jgi:hypothetical protein
VWRHLPHSPQGYNLQDSSVHSLEHEHIVHNLRELLGDPAAAPTATESACPSAFYTFHAPAEAVCPCPFSHSRHPKASHPTWCAKCVWGEACLKLKRKQYLGWTAGACNPRVDCISKQRELLALLYVGSCLLCCI